MAYFRSAIFLIISTILTIPFGFIVGAGCFIIPLPYRFRIVSVWRVIFLYLVEKILGISMEVRGRENIPNEPCIIYCKHQSAWETVALQAVFWPCVFVLKRELYWIPFFGWGLWAIRSIGIDRKSGKTALKQILSQGQQRYQEKLWIVIFPEGTRMPPGKQGEFRIGGAMLATQKQIPLLPIAHNAGECWGKNSFCKYPGKITMSIGEVIDPQGHDIRSINEKAAKWLENEMASLPAARLADKK